MRRRSGFLLLAATMLVIAGISRPARAQDEPELGVGLLIQKHAVVPTDEVINIWVFARPEGAVRIRSNLESALQRELSRVDPLLELTPEQKKKLELAGRGDLKRYLDRAEATKEKIHRAQGDSIQIKAILTEWQGSRAKLNANFFGEGSLFAKTRSRILTPGQRARLEEQERIASYRLRVQWVVFPLARQLGLSQEQRRRFVARIVEGTRPLPRYGLFDDDAVLLQTSRLPEAQLRPIFDEDQWQLLRQRFDRAKQMEKILIAGGFLPKNEVGRAPQPGKK